MNKQIDKIRNTNFDTFIIFDACRYDYFEKLYEDYFDGDLEKVWSPASCTPRWIEKAFPDKYDFTYVSGNPGLSSAGKDVSWCRYDASKHFKKVIDVWDYGWDETLATTPPNEVTLAAMFEGKKIVHYIQPHFPFIGEHKILRGGNKVNNRRHGGKGAVGRIIEESGYEYVKIAYEENVKLVMEYTTELIDFLDNEKIIITADHGEFLDRPERHPCGRNDKILREVPWLSIT